MAPTPPQSTHNSLPHDLYLILTFPTLTSVYSATSYLSAIADCARRSNNLLIIIKIAQNSAFTNSTTRSYLHSNSSLAASSSPASAPTSSPSSPAQPSSSNTSPRLSTPLTDFHKLQTFLSRVYSAATRAFLEQDRPLAKVEVVIEELRGLPFCLPNGAEVVRITVEEDEIRSLGKGKGHSTEEATPDRERSGDGGRREGYEVAALGGTFDHLHAGHRILLTLAACITKDDGRLIVGVSDTNLLKSKKHSNLLEPLSQRINHVRAFLELIRPTLTHDVVPIQDVYGPTATDPTIEALVVSDETVAGGEAINKLRREKELGELEVWVIKLVADDGGAEGEGGGEVGVAGKMGSTAIRGWLAGRQEERSGQV